MLFKVKFTLVALWSELLNKPNKNVTVVSLKKCVRTTSAQWAEITKNDLWYLITFV